jgi:hypothetical protein
MGDTQGDGEDCGSTGIPVSSLPDPVQGVSVMKSKLLQRKRYCLDQSDALLDDQQENTEDSSAPWKGQQTPPDRVDPAVDAQARKDFPGLLKRSCRPTKS